MLMNNKKGWIRIVEAMIAILLITGVVLVLINKGYIGKSDISEKIYTVQRAILREIELDETLRSKVISATLDSEYVPPQTPQSFPPEIINKIKERSPDYLICGAKICGLDKICSLTNIPPELGEKEIYAQPIAITTSTGASGTFNPRQLKLFCWTV